MNFWVVDRQLLLFGAACFFLGLIIGVTASIFYSGAMIDQKAIELEMLYSELSERNSRIEKLESSLADQRSRIVQDLKIGLNIKDPYLVLKISDAARQLLNELIGQELNKLDPNLIRTIIDGRVIYINDQPYTLYLKYLVLAETTALELDVKAGSAE